MPRTYWQDEVTDQNGDTIQEGTAVSATNLNSIEDRIEFSKANIGDIAQRVVQLAKDVAELFIIAKENKLSISQMFQKIIQMDRNIDDVKGEIVDATLTNTKSYPFNNSEVTVSLETTRDYTTYEVKPEILDGSNLGNIEIYDKQTNGFKARYTGSAESAELRFHIRGGMIG